MSESAPVVYIVDDDYDMRESLEYLLASVRIRTKAYASARDFLSAYNSTLPGCLVCDVRMPDIGGLELVENLSIKGYRLPVIFMTAFADVPMAIRALKMGASEFVEKPFNAQVMLDKIQAALARDLKARSIALETEAFGIRLADLTAKDRETLDMIVEGLPNKTMAARLDLTERAVEIRRASLMKKLAVHSTTELVRMVTRYQVLQEDH